MRSGFRWLVTFLLAAQALAAAPTEDALRYVRLYEAILTRADDEPKADARTRLVLADIAARLAQRRSSAEYSARAVQHFELALPELLGSELDFKDLRGLGLVASRLEGMGLLTEKHHAVLRTLAEREWKAFLASDDDGDYNIRIAQALGCAGLARALEKDAAAEAGPIKERLEEYWAKIKATGDLDEDASNYTCLGIAFCIELAEMLGHEDDLRAPGFRRMFARQRDTVSPTGCVPEFGDGYFYLERHDFDWLFVCEYAAVAFDDPTYLTAARKLYDADAFLRAPFDEWERAPDLISLPLSTRAPESLPALSLVTMRANRASTEPVIDKLILRTGPQPGAAMIMLDLYAAGSHAHPEKSPSVGYYEADGVPLFHNHGRHRTRSAIMGNSAWALEEGQAFPGVWKVGEWFTMNIPAERLPHAGNGDWRVGDRLTLRNFANPQTESLALDNLRLEGPEGVRLLDGFEDARTWHSSLQHLPGLKLETSADHTQGKASQRLNWGVLKAGPCARLLSDAHNFSFTPGDFDTLRIDLKYTGVRPYAHIRDLCDQIDLGDQALPHTLASARAEQRGHDAFGEAIFSRYVIAGAHLQRRIVLTAEGCLVIRDRWTAGLTKPAWTAGQLWQLYTLKERGPDWFCAEDDGAYLVDSHPVRRRMLVKFAVEPGTETFAEKLQQPYYCPNPDGRPAESFFTVGSKHAVASGETQAFTLAVVPHAPEQPADDVAKGVEFSAKPGGVEVTLHPPGAATPVRVIIGDDGTWKVERSR